MKQLLTLLLLTIFLSVSGSQVLATTVKVMTFNIGSFFDLPADARLDRMNKLGDLIVDHQVEIVYLQEFNHYSRNNDLNQLLDRVASRDYPMYNDWVYYENPDRESGVLLILSKYPLDKASKQALYQLGDRTNRSAQSIIVRNTPIGWFRLSNLHTHNTEPCTNLRDLLNFFYQFDKHNTLYGGDFNILLAEKPIRDCRGGNAGSIDWDVLDISCRDTAQCKREGIDWFFVTNESDLYIQAQVNIGNVNNISDQHPAIVSYIGSDDPKFDNCKLQGFKLYDGEPEERNVRVTIDGNSTYPTTSNPYQHPVGPGGHRASVIPPSGMTVGYTLCYDRTDCHTGTPTPGNQVNFQCNDGKFIDLWWHFETIPDPTATPTDIPVPTQTPIPCENDPDVDRDGDITIFDYTLLIQEYAQPVTASNKRVDINCDDVINIIDYALLISSF